MSHPDLIIQAGLHKKDRERLIRLAHVGAQHLHWELGDNYVLVNDGHNGTPNECQHEDCVLARSLKP